MKRLMAHSAGCLVADPTRLVQDRALECLQERTQPTLNGAGVRSPLALAARSPATTLETIKS